RAIGSRPEALMNHGQMDLIIRNVRVADRASDEPMDLGIRDGRIVAIERELVANAETYDARGRLACAGLIESHIHLDKSRTSIGVLHMRGGKSTRSSALHRSRRA